MRRQRKGSIAGFLLGFGIFVTILGAYATSEEWKDNSFDAMEPTPISGLEMGKQVKIVGRVDSSPEVGPVIDQVTTRTSSKHVSTHYEFVDHFTVADRTGSVVVTMNTEPVHRMTGGRYDIGDEIVVVGVVKDWGGEKSVSLQGVSKTTDGFGEKGALRYFGEGVLAIGILMTVSGAALIIMNRRKGGPETSAPMAPVTPEPQFGVPGVVSERYGWQDPPGR